MALLIRKCSSGTLKYRCDFCCKSRNLFSIDITKPRPFPCTYQLERDTYELEETSTQDGLIQPLHTASGKVYGVTSRLQQMYRNPGSPKDYVGQVEAIYIPGFGWGLMASDQVAVGTVLLCCSPLLLMRAAPGAEQPPSLEQLVARAAGQQWSPLEQAVWADLGAAEQRISAETIPPLLPQWAMGLGKSSARRSRMHPSINIHTAVHQCAISMPSPDPALASLREEDTMPLTGIWPWSSLANHSCCPNAVAVLLGETLVVCAVQEIGPGEEVTLNYLGNAATAPRSIRAELLQARYGFRCSCPRCSIEEASQKVADDIFDVAAQLVDELKESLIATTTEESLPALEADATQAGEFLEQSQRDLVQKYRDDPSTSFALGGAAELMELVAQAWCIAAPASPMAVAALWRWVLTLSEVLPGSEQHTMAAACLVSEAARAGCLGDASPYDRHPVQGYLPSDLEVWQVATRAHVSRYGPLDADLVEDMIAHGCHMLKQIWNQGQLVCALQIASDVDNTALALAPGRELGDLEAAVMVKGTEVEDQTLEDGRSPEIRMPSTSGHAITPDESAIHENGDHGLRTSFTGDCTTSIVDRHGDRGLGSGEALAGSSDRSPVLKLDEPSFSGRKADKDSVADSRAVLNSHSEFPVFHADVGEQRKELDVLDGSEVGNGRTSREAAEVKASTAESVDSTGEIHEDRIRQITSEPEKMGGYDIVSHRLSGEARETVDRDKGIDGGKRRSRKKAAVTKVLSGEDGVSVGQVLEKSEKEGKKGKVGVNKQRRKAAKGKDKGNEDTEVSLDDILSGGQASKPSVSNQLPQAVGFVTEGHGMLLSTVNHDIVDNGAKIEKLGTQGMSNAELLPIPQANKSEVGSTLLQSSAPVASSSKSLESSQMQTDEVGTREETQGDRSKGKWGMEEGGDLEEDLENLLSAFPGLALGLDDDTEDLAAPASIAIQSGASEKGPKVIDLRRRY